MSNTMNGDGEDGIGPAPQGSPGDVASQLFVEGVLGYMAEGAGGARTRRLSRVLSALHAPAEETHAAAPLRFRLPRWTYAMAAGLLAAAGIALFFIPTERSALGEVQRAAAVFRAGGDRRFDIKLFTTAATQRTDVQTIDIRSPGNLVLVTHKPPWRKRTVIVGHDADGYWTIRDDGIVDRTSAERELPPWIRIGHQTLFEEPLDELLIDLPRDFPTLVMEPHAHLEGNDTDLNHITATRSQVSGPEPDVVELWIDPATRELERLEFHWPRTAEKVAGNEADEAAMDDEPDHDSSGGPGDRSRRGGPGGPGGPRPPHDDGMGGPRDDGFDGGDGPGPRDGDGLMDRDDRRRPPPPRKDGPRGRGDGPHGPPPERHQEGEPGPRGDKDMPSARPAMVKLVMQRVDAAAFASDWFVPGGHPQK